MRKAFLLAILFLSILSPVIAQSADIIDSSIEDRNGGQDDFVLGRPATSTFEYRINDPYQPIDTAIVIDNSGSMNDAIGDVKEAAKNYVDGANLNQGDKIGVGILDQEIQSLTGNAQSAKNAIDDTTDYGGNSCIACGVRTGSDILSSGSNPVQVMILLADAQSSEDPGDDADTARSNGIRVDGIMYSGADTNKFESLTDASGCSLNENENDDGDNCWYGSSGTIDEVYNTIQQQVEAETDVNLRMRKRDMAYSTDSDDYNNLGGGNEEYVNNYFDVDAGQRSRTLTWRPTDYGSYDLLTGDSVLEVSTEDGSDQWGFSNQFSAEVGYVDFELVDFTVERDDSQVNLEAEIANNGNVDSLGDAQTSNPRKLFVEDSSTSVSTNIPSIPAGGSENVSFTVGNSKSIVDSVGIEDLSLHVDAQGFWNGKSGSTAVPDAVGEALEPDETDNEVQIGYPPRVRDIQFSDIDGEHAFSVQASVDILTDSPDFGECRLKFTNQENANEFPSSGWVQGQLTEVNDNTASCTYDSFNSSVSGFEPTDNVEVNITAENDEGVTGWNADNHEIINRPPEVTALEPMNDDPVWERDVVLRISVDDPEQDNIELIEFNDEIDNQLIESLPNPPDVNGEGTFEVQWQDLNLGEYEWGAEVEDKWDSTVIGPFAFERVVSQNYRVQNTVDHQYSSLIVDEDGEASMFFESDVVTDNRTVSTFVEGDGIDVEYADGSTQKTYEVDTGEPDRFQLRIEALDTGQNELRIITEDDSVSANTTTTFPVYVRESVEEGQPLPGLNFYYLLIIGLFSSVLYFASL